MSEQHSGIAELDERIPFLLAQLGSYVSSDFQHRLAPIGADPRTYAVLLALAADDGQSQRQLSARLGIHRNAMVTVIDNLENRGLAKRLTHPDDRRAFAITLTAKARRLLPPLPFPGCADFVVVERKPPPAPSTGVGPGPGWPWACRVGYRAVLLTERLGQDLLDTRGCDGGLGVVRSPAVAAFGVLVEVDLM